MSKTDKSTRFRLMPMFAGVAITVFWLGMMLTLVRDRILPHHRQTVLASESIQPGSLTDNWQDVNEYVVVVSGKRDIGGGMTSIRRLPGSVPRYEVEFRFGINIMLLGVSRPVSMVGRGTLNANYDLESFTIMARLGALDWQISGLAVENELLVEVTEYGKTSRQKLALEKRISFLEAVRPLVTRKLAIKPGTSVSVPVVDPIWSLQRGYMQVTIGNKERVRVRFKDVEAYRVESKLNDLVTVSWIDDQGNTLRRDIAPGLSLERTTKEHAQAISDVMKESIPTHSVDQDAFREIPAQSVDRLADKKMSPLSIFGSSLPMP